MVVMIVGLMSTVGVYAAGVGGCQLGGRRRLFRTAPPRSVTGRIRKAAAEVDLEIASMGDEEKCGPSLPSLTFGEAAERLCRAGR